MKKLFSFFILACIGFLSFAQNWVNINSETPKAAKILLTAADINNSAFNVELKGFYIENVTIPQGQKIRITVENTTPILEAGAPDLPKTATSLIVPDNQAMDVVVTYSNYVEYQNIDIAPSKGNFTRDIDPSTVPYTYGPAYSQNQFYPGTLAELREPYILRDFRGQTVITYPFQYNPVTKVLRVYHNLSLNVVPTQGQVINPFIRTEPLTKLNKEFSNIYNIHFLNYNTNYKYTPLDEHDRMLIICYGNFMSAMQPFVDWKNDIGIPTEIINVSTAGTTAAAIKTYVTNYYNTNKISFLLLIGDATQVPTFTVSGGGSDNTYGYLTGSDHYQEFFVGRFSAETADHVAIQVNRTIRYEKTPSTTSGLFNKCIGIASDQGPGDDNEYDYQHIRNINTDLLDFTYTSQYEFFDGSQGGSDASGDPTPTQISVPLNAGAGIINYTGHGSNTSWGSSGFSNTDVNNLTNTNVWPFIWSVACVNGNFVSTTCFAEAWLRAGTSSQPEGAVATLMSTINQSWKPPMEGQDEMVDILVESYVNNIKRTFGGLSVNGMFKMNDTYNDVAMTDTWTIFGDPSLMVRTDDPHAMVVTHTPSIMMTETNFQVNCNAPDAFVCLTINHQIIGSGYVTAGVANITFPTLTTTDSILVTVTAFNYTPYQGKVAVIDIMYPDDAQALNLFEPQLSYNCTGVAVEPKLIIRNSGTNTLTSLNATSILNGTPSSVAWAGSLASFETDTITFPSVMFNLGSNNFAVYISQPNGNTDANRANDTIKRTVNVADLPVISSFTANNLSSCSAPLSVEFTNTSQNAISYLWDFGDGTTSTEQNPIHEFDALGVYDITLTASAGVCGNDISFQEGYVVVGATPPLIHDTSSCGESSFLLTATGDGTIYWYDVASGGTPLNTGNSYQTPTLSSTTTYYVENVVEGGTSYTARTNKTTSGAENVTAEQGLIFDAYQPFILKSVKIYSTSNSTSSKTITLKNSTGTETYGTITATNVPVGESRVTLNFNVPAGTDLKLVAPGYSNLWRDQSTADNIYPFTLTNLLQIKTSTAGTTPGRYYYFYDWEVELPDCNSARSALTAFINDAEPTADFSFNMNGASVTFSDQSTVASSYSWNFGDGSSSSLPNPTHTYSTEGTFTVELTVSNGCGTDVITKDVTITFTGINETSGVSNINIYPNPSANQSVTLSFVNINSDVNINIYNLLGNLVDHISKSQITNGVNSITYNTAHLQSGIYFVEFNFDKNRKLSKLVITR